VDTLIKTATILVITDRRFFYITDESSADTTTFLPPEGGWIEHGPNAVVVTTVGDDVPKAVRFELWNAPPPSPDTPEVTEGGEVDLPTGSIGVSALPGFTHDVFEMPRGRYRVRVSGWNRQSTHREYQDIGSRTRFDAGDPEFAAAVERLTGQERYLVQFWPYDPSPR
jgi:hypothetical protein